jgi:type IV pilus assembly protein PilA
MPTWLIILLCTVGAFVLVIPVLAVLSIYGMRKYIVNAKTAEARSALAAIGRDAVATHTPAGYCASASAPVPAHVLSGAKYQSAPGDWEVDRAANAGFACLGFSMSQPQYYQYIYTAKRGRAAFEAQAHGDLDADGLESTFTLTGDTGPDGAPVVAPQITEKLPEE